MPITYTNRKGFTYFSGTVSQISDQLNRHAQFSSVLRFTLIDAAQRAFEAERMCYLGSIDADARCSQYNCGRTRFA